MWATPAAEQETTAELVRTPTAVELTADAGDLDMIRELFGSRANTIINCLLAFDAYFAWYYPLKKSVPFRCDMAQREERALDNARRAIDMHEIMERVTIRNHKSFLVHGAIYKLSRDILRVGDVWATDLSPLELQNAETKRVAKRAAVPTSSPWPVLLRGWWRHPRALKVPTSSSSTRLTQPQWLSLPFARCWGKATSGEATALSPCPQRAPRSGCLVRGAPKGSAGARARWSY